MPCPGGRVVAVAVTALLLIQPFLRLTYDGQLQSHEIKNKHDLSEPPSQMSAHYTAHLPAVRMVSTSSLPCEAYFFPQGPRFTQALIHLSHFISPFSIFAKSPF